MPFARTTSAWQYPKDIDFFFLNKGSLSPDKISRLPLSRGLPGTNKQLKMLKNICIPYFCTSIIIIFHDLKKTAKLISEKNK